MIVGRKRRSPDSYAPRCEVITKELCEKVCSNIGISFRALLVHQVPVKSPKYIEVPVCSKVPRYTCSPTVRKVADTKCEDEVYQECSEVPKQVENLCQEKSFSDFSSDCARCSY